MIEFYYKKNKLFLLDDLHEVLNKEREKGKKIVFTNGCFDLIHPGHVRYLYQARSMGDILVVGLNSDSSVKMYKGKKRPVMNQWERAEVLSALEMVDYIVIFSERTPENLIRTLKPHIQVKGGDYTREQVPEAHVLESYGGELRLVSLVEGKSTTGIIERIIKSI